MSFFDEIVHEYLGFASARCQIQLVNYHEVPDWMCNVPTLQRVPSRAICTVFHCQCLAQRFLGEHGQLA